MSRLSLTLVYHLMPQNVVGGALQPLNQLKIQHPEMYEKYVQKYRGREQVERRIPILDCLWNDVVFFSNVHPKAIRDGFIAVGKHWKPQKWYAIDTISCGFNTQNTVIYHPDMNRAKGDFTLSPEHFATFDSDKLETIHELPIANLAYYRAAAESGKRIFVWRGLPHILYAGSVSLTDVEFLTI